MIFAHEGPSRATAGFGSPHPVGRAGPPSWRASRRDPPRGSGSAGRPTIATSIAGGARRLDLRGRISTVLWATGYGRAHPWLGVPVLDGRGELVQRHGVTAAPGLFALGMRFQRTRKSHLLGGVGEDAAWIADAIVSRGHDVPPERAA